MTLNRPLLVMLDYDGTLTPIVTHFADAQISDDRLAYLKQLALQETIQLALVSGRSVEQLQLFLKGTLDGLPVYLVGLHGGETYDLKLQKFMMQPDAGYKIQIQKIRSALKDSGVLSWPGVELEDKGYSLALHYRLADPAVGEKAAAAFREEMKRQGLNVDFFVREGKKALEALPQGFNKGVGVQKLIDIATSRFGQTPSLLYMGDDVTDYDAFRVVYPLGGTCIYVGKTLLPEVPPVTENVSDVPAVYAYLNANI